MGLLCKLSMSCSSASALCEQTSHFMLLNIVQYNGACTGRNYVVRTSSVKYNWSPIFTDGVALQGRTFVTKTLTQRLVNYQQNPQELNASELCNAAFR